MQAMQTAGVEIASHVGADRERHALLNGRLRGLTAQSKAEGFGRTRGRCANNHSRQPAMPQKFRGNGRLDRFLPPLKTLTGGDCLHPRDRDLLPQQLQHPLCHGDEKAVHPGSPSSQRDAGERRSRKLSTCLTPSAVVIAMGLTL